MKLHFGSRMGSGQVRSHSSHWLHSWPITAGHFWAREERRANSSAQKTFMSEGEVEHLLWSLLFSICLLTINLLTYLILQEVKGGFDEDQGISDQSGLGAVHELGTLVQVLDHSWDSTDPALTVQPVSVSWKNTRITLSCWKKQRIFWKEFELIYAWLNPFF